MDRRGFFGTLAGITAAAALPLARKAVEVSGYTLLKLPHDLPTGETITLIKTGEKQWYFMGSSAIHKVKTVGYWNERR